MKKNISINISGIIFHIEEDAYEKLRDYLDSINQYFSSFDDSMEIIADIENRIAEIFLAKLNENKQIINQEDVDDLITTMGSIKDFKAVEDPEEEAHEEQKQESSESKWKDTSTKKLFRDEKRKLLGGVAAGVAHYFNIDPLWARLLFIILFFASYGIAAMIYIIMWIAVPGNSDLTEDKKLKKLYRDPDQKVLGGVSSGMALYFGIDVVVVRLLFVLSILLGGTGIFIYIILWIILPEAKSITEKVQMKGEPVTLSNIESNIKKSFKVKEDDEENIFIKILLFPFRLIAIVIETLGKALGPILMFLVDFIRVAVGVIMIITGIGAIFSLVLALFVIFGVVSTAFWDPMYLSLGELGIPLNVILDSFPVITSIAGFFALLIPFLFLILLGASLIAKRIIFNALVGWTLFALFIISSIVLSFNIPAIAYQFNEDGEYRETEVYDIENKTAVLKLHEAGMENYHGVELRLRGHEGSELRLEKSFESQGYSRQNAIENAKMVTYDVLHQDSILIFDSNIQFKKDAIFRAQRLEMTLYIPYNQKFMMSQELRHIIRNTIHRYGYRVWDMDDNIWTFTERGLECLTCESQNDRSRDISDYDRTLNFKNFSDVDISAATLVNIEKDERYGVWLKGSSRHIDDIDIYQNGDKLYIAYEDSELLKYIRDRDQVTVKITMPELDDLELSGATKVYLSGFDQRSLTMSLGGAAFVKANVDIDELELDLGGASEVQLEGKGRELNAELSGASALNAYDFEVRNATIDVYGASSAKVFVTNDLKIEEAFASSVKYKGDPKVTRER
ncbi:MAG: PspC domain-containing protein [Fulvivirga sp.]|nr:PspC domain-containing protein [Fulvivirga sp.]